MPKADQTELLVKERGAHALMPWLIAAVFAGFSGYLYMMVYRPLQEDSRKRKQELVEQRALARDAKREVDEVKGALDKSQAETKQVREDLMHTAEAKDDWSLSKKALARVAGSRRARDVELRAKLNAVAREVFARPLAPRAPLAVDEGTLALAFHPLVLRGKSGGQLELVHRQHRGEFQPRRGLAIHPQAGGRFVRRVSQGPVPNPAARQDGRPPFAARVASCIRRIVVRRPAPFVFT